jgi:hypothetical protein
MIFAPMKLRQHETLYCFTPEVMLRTFITELALGIFVFVRHRMSRFGKVAATTLLLLASFQFAEYGTDGEALPYDPGYTERDCLDHVRLCHRAGFHSHLENRSRIKPDTSSPSRLSPIGR